MRWRDDFAAARSGNRRRCTATVPRHRRNTATRADGARADDCHSAATAAASTASTAAATTTAPSTLSGHGWDAATSSDCAARTDDRSRTDDCISADAAAQHGRLPATAGADRSSSDGCARTHGASFSADRCGDSATGTDRTRTDRTYSDPPCARRARHVAHAHAERTRASSAEDVSQSRRRSGRSTSKKRIAAKRAPGRKLLTDQWRAWIAENLMLGADDASIVARLRAERVTRETAEKAITEIRRSPVFAAGTGLGRGSRRLLAILQLQRELRSHAGLLARVERRRRPTAAEFYARYVATSTPVVFTDAMQGWKALDLWSPEYFKKAVGDAEIEATADRDGDPDYDMHTREHSRKVRMADYADRVIRARRDTNDFYLVANNHAMEKPGMARLADDVVMDPEYFDVTQGERAMSLWFGPAGTVTPLHHDTTNIVFHQVYGKKRFLMISPFETALFRYVRGVYCDVDPEKLENHPDLANLPVAEVVLAPGDALFIPVGWWHHVRALDKCIGISFTSLRVPNDYGWFIPGSIA
jgi:hypothetical protein